MSLPTCYFRACLLAHQYYYYCYFCIVLLLVVLYHFQDPNVTEDREGELSTLGTSSKKSKRKIEWERLSETVVVDAVADIKSEKAMGLR